MGSAKRIVKPGPIEHVLAAGSLLAFAGAVHASCGAAFCMVNTNWNVQGAWTEPGARVDLRYEYINQDQPRSGSDKVAIGQIPRDHDEIKTVNRNWIANFDYAFNANWGVGVMAPVGDRDHQHFDNGSAEFERWKFTNLGDMRVLGRYQILSSSADAPQINVAGVNFGLKLPTGDTDIVNSQGVRAERTLQPGTGTTDSLVGAYYRSSLPLHDSSWFIQGLYQQPLNSHDDYRPGARTSVDLGYRYDATPKLGLMLQLNALWRGRDSGVQAEPEDSGGKYVFVSPGLSYALTKDLQVYGFVQKAAYQYVNGVQLTADWSGVAGFSLRF
jgi:hypothetical protein